MPVNLAPIDPAALLPVAGVTLSYAEAAVKKPGRKDVLLIELAAGSQVAGVFTRNRFCAAPVHLSRAHLASGQPTRALVVNTGNANAGTGEDGRQRALAVCQAVAEQLGCQAEQVLPFSTGVILEPLPFEKIIGALPQRRAGSWADAAEAIMTTDILPKAASRQVELGGKTVTLTGIAKGAGMIHPNMATMLGFIVTDAKVSQPVLQMITQEIADLSFNSITVDGDTSTNDSFVVVATGKSGQNEIDNIADPRYEQLKAMLGSLALELAQAIVRDGEGATKFISIQVENAESRAEARQVAYAIAHSPLVKTAFFASDPNLGRILAAIGYSGVPHLDTEKVRLYLGDVLVAEHGGRAASYTEAAGQAVMAPAEITVRVDLQRGSHGATVYTCDLSKEYVAINADYRS